MFFQKSPHSLPKAMFGGAGKRLFLGLMSASCVLLCLFLLAAWVIPYVGFSAIHPALPYILGGFTALLIFCIAWMCCALAYHVYTGNNLVGIHVIRRITVRLMFPLMEILGRMLGIQREKVRLSFVKVNNEMVLASHLKVAAKDILLLLPHCLQNSRCPNRLNHNINNCQRCGLCPLGELLQMRDKWGFAMVVATGGTVARRIVVQTKPKLILAIACERDLTSGIQDTYPLPVFGIINDRPLGPCLDTLVNVQLLEQALYLFVEHPKGAESMSANHAPNSDRAGGNSHAA